MDSERIRELIERLKVLYQEARLIERGLAALGLPDPRLLDPEQMARLGEALEELERAEQVFQALFRVDFNDDYYEFIRAIDGDTIVVAPPRQLRQWMNDIHVRLYGLETPELWEQPGEQYREHLEELCAIDAHGRLMIVWERERPGTNYEGFPRSSFERGIGHVFYRGEERRFVYVNGLMHVLRYSSLDREGRSLLRGHRHLEILQPRLPWGGQCPSWREPKEESSSTLRAILATGPPACLLTYAAVSSLDPRDPAFTEKVCSALRENWQFGCPLEQELHRCNEALREQLGRQQASPFDVPLTLASMWAAERRLTKR